MTSAGQPVAIGGITIGPGVRLGGTAVGGPVVAPGTGGGALDDLADVDAPPDQPGLLERQGDGRVRPVPRDEITTEWFSGHGQPPPVIGGAKRGDMYLDLDTGELYQLA